MLSYERAKQIVIGNTIPNGKVYYSADAGSFYIFTIVNKDTPNIKGLMTGTTFIAIDKIDWNVFTIDITDKRIQNVKTIEVPPNGTEKR